MDRTVVETVEGHGAIIPDSLHRESGHLTPETPQGKRVPPRIQFYLRAS